MGFVKISDDLPSWAWYGDNNTLLVYMRLLLGAVWHETEYQNVTLQRGQIATTLPKIAKENGITERQARTILERLKSTGKVSVKTTSKFSIITLENYDCVSENVSQLDSQMSDKRQTTCQSNDSPSLFKSDIQNNRNTDNAHTREGVGVEKTDYESSFIRFWAAYPKKTAKQQALKAWQKLNPDKALIDVILSSLERQKQSVQWTKDNGQYIPYPATWLNGKRWEDETTEVNSNGNISSNSQLEAKSESDWLRGFNGQ
ncbi:MAG: hypothetical protein ACI4JZ_06705 [Oscillospiraceae bacterium]